MSGIAMSVNDEVTPVYGLTGGPIEISFDLGRSVEKEQLHWVCMFWNYSSGEWLEDGCKPVKTDNFTVTCACTHLTDFTVDVVANGAVCGDSRRTVTEGCDDGGVVSGDGCSSECKLEFGWYCYFGSTVSIDVCYPYATCPYGVVGPFCEFLCLGAIRGSLICLGSEVLPTTWTTKV
eukprot:3381935-Rhodomonas_salina.1